VESLPLIESSSTKSQPVAVAFALAFFLYFPTTKTVISTGAGRAFAKRSGGIRFFYLRHLQATHDAAISQATASASH
jgi:hypothetical protein